MYSVQDCALDLNYELMTFLGSSYYVSSNELDKVLVYKMSESVEYCEADYTEKERIFSDYDKSKLQSITITLNKNFKCEVMMNDVIKDSFNGSDFDFLVNRLLNKIREYFK